jgi:hypothetical protein
MENLNSDEKMSILMKLEGKEINKVCQVSKIMRKICTDERYNPLWRNKIKEEFNIVYTGSKAYDEFKFLYRLKNTEIHTVKITNEYDWGSDGKVMLFYTERAAFNFMTETAFDIALEIRRNKEKRAALMEERGELDDFLQDRSFKNLEEFLGPDENYLQQSIYNEFVEKYTNKDRNYDEEESGRYMIHSNFYLEYEKSRVNF